MPVQEMSWERWKQLHPNTTVVSGDLGYGRPYQAYPYGSYRFDEDLLFAMSVDRSRPIKARGLPIRIGTGVRGYPF